MRLTAILGGLGLNEVCRVLQFKTYKVIYRRYAGLFFSLCVDITDNELAYLESIHLFVEILDHYFSNVCELDLVFNFHKVCPSGKLKFVSLPDAPSSLFVHPFAGCMHTSRSMLALQTLY